MAKAKSGTSVYILIDRSGSMASRWNETLGAVNAYVSELTKAKATKNALATVCLFDATFGLDFVTLRSGMSVGDWEPITDNDATPRGMTPLYDAIGRIANIVETDSPKKAVVAVVTDGAENASKEVTREGAKAYFDKLRTNGFQVVFLGADFDAFGQSASVGTTANQTLVMRAGNYNAAFKSLANATMAYSATGAVMSFSDDDRKKAGW